MASARLKSRYLERGTFDFMLSERRDPAAMQNFQAGHQRQRCPVL